MPKPIKPASFAKALLLEPKKHAHKKAWLECLALLASNASWRGLVTNPNTKDKAVEVLKAILNDDSWELEVFVHTLMKYQLLLSTPVVLEKYQQLVDQSSGLAKISVSSANDLSSEMKENIDKYLKNVFSANQVKTTYEQDTKLLSGFRAKWGDKVIDHSLLGKLKNLNSQWIHK